MATPEQVESVGFEPFFRDWYPRLVSLGVAMTGRRTVAQEVAQEALLRAHQRWDTLAGYDHPGAWVKRVAVNLCIDHLRSVGREQRAITRLGSQVVDSPGYPDVERWATLVDGLSTRQRVIVTLFYADDQQIDSIAELLDIAPGTVKAQLFKAREKMRSRLDEEEWS